MSHIANDILRENLFEEVVNELLEKHPYAHLPWIEEVAERVTLKRLKEMECLMTSKDKYIISLRKF